MGVQVPPRTHKLSFSVSAVPIAAPSRTSDVRATYVVKTPHGSSSSSGNPMMRQMGILGLTRAMGCSRLRRRYTDYWPPPPRTSKVQ